MRALCILILASGLCVCATTGAKADFWSNPNYSGNISRVTNDLVRRSAGAPLPVAGAGLPFLAAAGLYYAIRRLRRD